jgi:hypothetical protein
MKLPLLSTTWSAALALVLATASGGTPLAQRNPVAHQIGRASQNVQPAFNPQPDPPRSRHASRTGREQPAFNPQPDPPGRWHA